MKLLEVLDLLTVEFATIMRHFVFASKMRSVKKNCIKSTFSKKVLHQKCLQNLKLQTTPKNYIPKSFLRCGFQLKNLSFMSKLIYEYTVQFNMGSFQSHSVI